MNWATIAFDLTIIVLLVLVKGFFTGAEIALLAAPRSDLQKLADKGDRSAHLALHLMQSASQLLPTAQVCINFTMTVAAALAGWQLIGTLSTELVDSTLTLSPTTAQVVSGIFAVAFITFFSTWLGQLVPRRLALAHATRVARWVAMPMQVLANVLVPVTWMFVKLTDYSTIIFGAKAREEMPVSIEEIERLIRTGTGKGILEPTEQRVALEALRLGDRSARDIMQPRMEMDALEVNTPPNEVLGAVALAGYSRLPVYEGDLDHILGSIHIKDVLRCNYLGIRLDLRRLMHPPILVPETLPLDRLLVALQNKKTHLAIVLDEFGGTQGVVTLQDIVDELIGEMRDEHQTEHEHRMVQREDLNWLVDGAVGIEEFFEKLEFRPENDGPRRYTTVAGLVLSALGRIPTSGEYVEWQGWRFEVLEMEGARIHRLLVTSLPSEEPNGDKL